MTNEDAAPDWFVAQLREKLGEEEANRTLEFFRRNSLQQKAMRDVSSDSDRCVGIVAPVFVEEELKLCLQRHFVIPWNSKLKDKLNRMFQQSQLGSFSVVIDIGYFLGIYREDAWADLDRIRKIRNTFAHDAHASSFDAPEVSKHCKHLKFVEKYIVQDAEGRPDVLVPCMPSGAVTHAIYELGKDLLGTPRKRFMTTCEHFVEMFVNTYPAGRTHVPHF